VLLAASLCNQFIGSGIALVIVDLDTESVRLVDTGDFSADSGATGIALTQDGGLVLCLQGSNDLLRLDCHLEPQWRVHVPGLTDIHSCAVHEEALWAVSTGSDSIVGLHLESSQARLVEAIRCADSESDTMHVNGVTMHDGELLASWFGPQWRSHPKHARLGAIGKPASGTIIANGIAQPHSVLSDGERIFVLGSYDGTIEEIRTEGRWCRARVPGYARGLAVGRWGAVVGVSGQRRRSRGLGTDNTDRPDAEERCLILRFDAVWNLIASIDLSWLAREIYDIVVLPPGHRPPSPADTMEAAKRRIMSLETRLAPNPGGATLRWPA
jgi:hypothetical protein